YLALTLFIISIGFHLFITHLLLPSSSIPSSFFFFFFNDTATTEIYTLSLHDALPISLTREWISRIRHYKVFFCRATTTREAKERSEEHTSELQSLAYLVCRLLLEKKKKKKKKEIKKR